MSTQAGNERTLSRPAAVLALAALFTGAVFAASSLRSVERVGDIPPVRLLSLVALALIALGSGALLITIRSRLSLPGRTLALTIGFNALLVVIKFVLSPRAIYDTNRRATFSFRLDEALGAVVAAGVVFFLYFMVLWILYRVHLRRYRRVVDPDHASDVRKLFRRALVVGLIMGGFALLTGGVGLFLALFAVLNASEYLNFVFSSGLSLLVALMLVAATTLAGGAFGSVTQQAVMVRDAAVLSSFFWVALSMIAAYHVLWVVYILALTSVWPLRVVVPK